MAICIVNKCNKCDKLGKPSDIKEHKNDHIILLAINDAQWS